MKKRIHQFAMLVLFLSFFGSFLFKEASTIVKVALGVEFIVYVYMYKKKQYIGSSD